MSADMNIQGAITSAQMQAVQTPKAAASMAATTKVAQQFEGVLVSQLLNNMFEGVKTDENFGGGEGEDMFRSLMVDEYGKQIAAQGGLGLSNSVSRELLKQQGLR